jgi:hypothetical protein
MSTSFPHVLIAFSLSNILLSSHARSIRHANIYIHSPGNYLAAYVLPGPPNSANLRTMLGPISSYSALVWQ